LWRGVPRIEVIGMQNWFLITHNLHAFQLVAGRLSALGVEVYSAQRIEIIKRTDRNTPRSIKKQLFPGYLFIRFCPEEVHTSTISDIPGVKGFVRFGNEICRVSGSVIETLKASMLLRVDSSVSVLECGNIPSDIVIDLVLIAQMKSSIERQTALLSLLQKERLHVHPDSLICSTIVDLD
jgi:transcriptional antiterminator RfaH